MAVSTWFREEIKGMVSDRYKSKGGYLDDTMMKGESSAGTVKFPVGGGRISMYELTGGIQRVNPSTSTLDMVTLTTKDFEAAAYFRMHDEARMGPSQKAKLADDLNGAIRRKKDQLKLAALDAFATAGATTLTDAPTNINMIGDGSAMIDLTDIRSAASYIRGTGVDEDLFYPLPELWFNQLLMYKEFASADYQGPASLPFAQAGRVKRKTWDGVHIFTVPDEYFIHGTGSYDISRLSSQPSVYDNAGYLDTFMWVKNAMGCETWWDQETADFDKLPELEGSPYIAKVQLSSAAIGILPEGVKKLRFKAIEAVTRPA